MGQITFSREELYDLVWAEPIAHIAQKHNINAADIRKACKTMGIPLPQMGYWQKIKFGKQLKIETLPKEYAGNTSITLHKTVDRKNKKQLNELLLAPEFVVPNKLTNPDKLVIAAKSAIAENKYKDKGRACTQRGYLNITVSNQYVERALLFMNTLIKLLRSKTYNLIVRDNGTYAVVDGEEIKVSFVEKVKRKMIPGPHWNTAEYTPSGILAFRIDGESYGLNSYEWKDGREKIEQKLDAILSKLEFESKRLKDEREKWRLIREQSERERLDKVERQKNRDNELNKFKELLMKSKRHQEVVAIRAYIDAIEKSTIGREPMQEIVDWILWAREKANWYDPMIDKVDDVLQDVDKDILKVNNIYY